MAKFLKVPLDENLSSDFFSPIRSKVDVILLLMRTIKYFISEVEVKRDDESNIYLFIDNMNRFIYESKKKVFSIRSPFSFYDKSLSFKDNRGIEIDSMMTSKIIALFSIEGILDSSVEDLDDYISEIFPGNSTVFPLIMNLISFEDGYLRFDNDPDPKRLDKDFHPLNHIDICYSNASTYKIGVYEEPSYSFMHDLLNLKIKAKFIQN